MSELRLFDPDIERGIDPDIERDMKRGIARDIDLAPTHRISPDTHMKPDITNQGTSRPATERPFDVEVVRSTRRRRTISAQMRDGVLRISIPNWMSKTEELTSVESMVKKFTRRLATDSIDLVDRARTLAKAHDLRTPAIIEWNDTLTAVWGLCTPSRSHIRLSTRLVGFPTWVLDYVIVHELAHLHVPGHGPDFWELVRRYPRSERAIGFLIAKSGESPDGSGDTCHDVDGSPCRGVEDVQ